MRKRTKKAGPASEQKKSARDTRSRPGSTAARSRTDMQTLSDGTTVGKHDGTTGGTANFSKKYSSSDKPIPAKGGADEQIKQNAQTPKDHDSTLRLNRAIAATGFCSRRKADEFIAAGRVKVNEVVVNDFNFEIDPEKDLLFIDGKQLLWRRHVYIALNKPVGVVTTMSDDRGRRTVMDLLPANLQHLRPVGRLDMYSEGLLLLTNDGELCQKLTHPVHAMGKLYRVSVRGKVANNDLTKLSQGIYLEDGPTLPAKVRLISRNESSSEFEITLVEGRNRQIRRMCSALGLPVIRLVRLGIGRIQLGQMSPGKWRYLTDAEVKLLFK